MPCLNKRSDHMGTTFRPARQNDALPLQPLVEYLLFWALLGLGTLAAGAGIFVMFMAPPGAATLRVVGAVVAIAGAGAVASAFAFWRRSPRDGSHDGR